MHLPPVAAAESLQDRSRGRAEGEVGYCLMGGMVGAVGAFRIASGFNPFATRVSLGGVKPAGEGPPDILTPFLCSSVPERLLGAGGWTRTAVGWTYAPAASLSRIS